MRAGSTAPSSRMPTRWSTSPAPRPPATRTRLKWARACARAAVPRPPRVLADAVAGRRRDRPLLAGGGIGCYGDHGAIAGRRRTSDSRGDEFITALSRDWQSAADPAVAAGARVWSCAPRRIVHRTSPPLAQLLPLFKLGLGARLGDGRQYFPMVSLRDWLDGVAFLVEHDTASGPFNLCCPHTPTNGEFTDALAGRRADGLDWRRRRSC